MSSIYLSMNNYNDKFHPNKEPKSPLIVMYAIRERFIYTDWFNNYVSGETTSVKGISHIESARSWDMYMTSASTKNFLIEVKVRGNWSMESFKKGNFKEEGAFIEKIKYRNLFNYVSQRKNKATKIEVVYLNFYKDGAVWWNLTELPEPVWTYRDSKNNAQNDGKRKIKEMGELQLKDATIWKYPIDIIDYNRQSKNFYEKFYPGFAAPNNYQLRT